jgi:hypothetical protein
MWGIIIDLETVTKQAQKLAQKQGSINIVTVKFR